MVPRPKLPSRLFRRTKDDAEPETKDAKASEAKTKEAKPDAKKPAAKAAAGSAAAKKPPAPNLQERMEGLQGWMAEIERKQGRMTYFGAAAAVVALLMGGAGLYLGITNQQDSADKDDFEALEQRVTEVGDSLKSSTEEQLNTLNNQLQGTQQRLDAIEVKQKQVDTTISTLQTQVESAANAQRGGGATTIPTPGAQNTPGANP